MAVSRRFESRFKIVARRTILGAGVNICNLLRLPPTPGIGAVTRPVWCQHPVCFYSLYAGGFCCVQEHLDTMESAYTPQLPFHLLTPSGVESRPSSAGMSKTS